MQLKTIINLSDLAPKCSIARFLRLLYYLQCIITHPYAALKVRKLRIAVYTVNYGCYDNLQYSPPQTLKADYFQFGDCSKSPPGWNFVPTPPIIFGNPRYSCKLLKIMPSISNILSSYDYTVYIDASTVINSCLWLEVLLINSFNKQFSVRQHPDRSNLLQEACFAHFQNKYSLHDLIGQALYYQREHGSIPNLWNTGLIVRNGTSCQLDDFWWNQMRLSPHCQISLPYAAARAPIHIHTLPVNIFRLKYIYYSMTHREHEWELVSR